MRFYPFVFTSTDEGGIAAYYNYSADGERNIKFTSPRLNIQQNASLFNNPPLVYPTLYASPLITMTPKGYTNVTEVESRASLLALPRCSNVTERKHYFEEGRRICSKLGGGMRGNVTVEEIDSRVPELTYNYDDQFRHQYDGIRQTFHDCIGADPCGNCVGCRWNFEVIIVFYLRSLFILCIFAACLFKVIACSEILNNNGRGVLWM